MRVVHLNSDPGVRPGHSKGAAVHVQAMRVAFTELGVQVIALDESNELKVGSRLRETHAHSSIDLIYERFSLHSYTGGRFARVHDIPYVLEINSPLDEEAERHRPLDYKPLDFVRLKELVQGASRLLCVSNSVAAWARARGAREEQILVAGNGVDARLFHPDRRAAGLSSGLSPRGAFVLGFHGRLRPWHGFDRLVKAARNLQVRGLPIHLLLVGKGEFGEVIGDQLSRESWTHVPWVEYEQVGALVSTFDVLPLSYDPDQPCYFSPLKLLEGMAAGVLAVVPTLGDLSLTVHSGRAGALYDPKAPRGLEDAIAFAYENPSYRRALIREGRRVAELRSWRAIAEVVLKELSGSLR